MSKLGPERRVLEGKEHGIVEVRWEDVVWTTHKRSCLGYEK
jgi:hypothetical protein